MKKARGSLVLIILLIIGFAIELVTGSARNEAALLKLGGLPDNGELYGEYWRIATYSFLHFNWLHLIVNVSLLLWIGRIVERQVGTTQTMLIYCVSVLCSAVLILLLHNWYPKAGATVGASGGIFGLLGAALIISYQQKSDNRLRRWLWTALLVGFTVSLFPGISMAGHVGGILGGGLMALLVKIRMNES
jgi:membrane associated rhomboid family serine protease